DYEEDHVNAGDRFRMDICPSLDELQKLLANDLEAPRAEALETHVDVCRACQQALERLTDATCLDRVRAGPPSPPDPRQDTALLPQEAAAANTGAAFLRELKKSPPAEALAL